MNLKKNLVFLGMMGSGKSSIGSLVSKKLKLEFIDIDNLIENETGLTISQIFEKKGENYFREIENEITLQELNKDNSVISLGGGAFLNKSIRSCVKKTSVSFWMDVSTNELIKRLKKTDKRPLLYKKDINDTIKKIYLDRKKIYNEANYKVKCTLLKSNEIVNKILKLYEKSGN